MSRWFLIPLALALGCDASTPSVEPPELPDPADLPVVPSAPFDEVAFSCCGSDRVRRVVAEYLDLQQALGHDDLALAQAELQALRGVALAAADDEALSGHSRGLAREVAGLVEPVADGSLDTIRDAFVEVSNKTIVLAQANPGGSKQLAVAFCVRTNANWLQGEPTILNPYLGSLEPSSGSLRR